MKNFSVNCKALILIFVCIFMADCGSDDNPTGSGDNVRTTDYVAKESFSHTVAVSKHTQFRIEGINGNISINGVSDSDTIVITGEKRVGSESVADAEEHLQYLEVTVQDLANEVYVKTTQPQKSYGRNYTVDYTVTLPKDLSVNAININGAVTIVTIDNSISADNINGTVIVKEINGNVSVNLINGGIEGEVTLPLNGIINMTLVNGDIELAVPQSTSAVLYAQVVNGTIGISGLDLRNETVSQNSLRGTLGNGQGTLSLSTVNGTIYLSGQ